MSVPPEIMIVASIVLPAPLALTYSADQPGIALQGIFMGFAPFIAIGSGAAIGAWLRWWLGLRLNAVFPTLPLGTLVANLLGGYIIGLAIGAIAVNAGLSPQARLFLMTGFCGGLTTFSTFSAETVSLLSRGQFGWAFGEIALHVCGSLAATALGILSIHLLRLSTGAHS